MSLQDSNAPDPSQPLTLDRPQTDPRLQQPYTPHQPRALPPALYVPNRPDRGPEDWGGDYYKIQAATMYPGMPSNPDMPSGFEAYPTAAKSAGYLAKWGSDNIRESAQQVSGLAMGFAPLLDMLSKGAFSKNFNASSLNSIKIQQQRLILEGDALQQRHAQELSDYGAIIAKADSLAKANPDRAAQFIEDGREELRFLAETKYRHGPLVAVLDSSGGLDAAKQFLSQEDAYFRDAWASNTALKKAAGVDEDVKTAEEWGEPRPTGARGGGIFGMPLDAQVAAQEERDPRTPDTPTGGDFNARLARNMRLSPQEMRAVQQEVATGKPTPGIEALKGGKETGLDHDIRRKVGLGVDATERHIDDVIDNPNMSTEQKMREIARTSTSVASDLNGLRRYQLDPKEQGIVNRARMTDRARRLFGDQFKDNNFDAVKAFKNPDRPENRVIVRAGNMGQAALNVFGAINETGENESIPRRAIENFIAHHLDPSDAKWTKIFDALMDFDTHFQGLESGTGTPRVGPMMAWLSQINASASPAQIRGAVMQNITAAFQTVNIQEQNWEKLLGRQDELVPGINAHDYTMLRDMVRMNTNTGEMPPDSVREVLAVSRPREQANKSFKDELPPLSMKNIREDYIPRIAAWENSPDPQKRRDAAAARRRIGFVSQIERLIPEVDISNANVRR